MKRFPSAPTTTALLGAGTINLETAETLYFNVIKNAGTAGGALFLVSMLRYEFLDGPRKKFKVLSGSGNFKDYSNFQVGNRVGWHHDQSGRPGAQPFLVEAAGDCTLETLQRFQAFAGKKSLGFMVFK